LVVVVDVFNPLEALGFGMGAEYFSKAKFMLDGEDAPLTFSVK
jgi:hypothetical protein